MNNGKRDYIAIVWKLRECEYYKGKPSPAEINAQVILNWLEAGRLFLMWAVKVNIYPDTAKEALSMYRSHFWKEALGGFKILNETRYKRFKEWLHAGDNADKKIRELKKIYDLQCAESKKEPIDTVSEILAREVPELVDNNTKKLIKCWCIEYTIRGWSIIPIEDIAKRGKDVMRRIGGLVRYDVKASRDEAFPIGKILKSIGLAEMPYSLFGLPAPGDDIRRTGAAMGAGITPTPAPDAADATAEEMPAETKSKKRRRLPAGFTFIKDGNKPMTDEHISEICKQIKKHIGKIKHKATLIKGVWEPHKGELGKNAAARYETAVIEYKGVKYRILCHPHNRDKWGQEIYVRLEYAPDGESGQPQYSHFIG
ncbi:MAG: hypothetical protein K6E55_10780 [Thermoguttaceae bacterium]|nr:hypothetical protein [Thermoguttaceae bacterium]